MKWQTAKNLAATLGFIIGAGFSAQAAVWTDTNTWNNDWEKKFSSWVENEYNEDMYLTGKYKGIPNDCADAVYFGRLIFSYENKLPYVIGDATGGANKITNRMNRWDMKGSEIDRVREFMNFVAWNASTKTFAHDSYPVKIDRTFVRPGAIWVRPSRETNLWNGLVATLTGKSKIVDPGHAETIKHISDSGAVMLIGSTTPAAVRRLTLTSSFLIMPESPETGIRNWILPQWYGQPHSSLPGYSLEQFSMGKTSSNNNSGSDGAWNVSESAKNGPRSFQEWRNDITTRLAQRPETRQEAIDRYAADLCSLVHSRAEIVQEAIAYKEKNKGACMSSSQYDAFSTPTRDKRIKAALKDLTTTTQKFGEVGLTGKVKNPEVVAALNKCEPIEISTGKTITLMQYMVNVAADQFSSNPNDTLNVRWGFESASSSCPTF
jgi:hypothetical protein